VVRGCSGKLPGGNDRRPDRVFSGSPLPSFPLNLLRKILSKTPAIRGTSHHLAGRILSVLGDVVQEVLKAGTLEILSF
jgi:hypothetical protein